MFRLLAITVILGTLSLNSAAQTHIEGDPAHGFPDSAATTQRASTRPASDMSNAPLPEVRLTPRDMRVTGLSDARLDLNGQWMFAHRVPDGFNGNATSISEWKTVSAPGHFALQGFPRMHEKEGVPVAYTKSVLIPADWNGKRVVLRFEGIDGLTRLWVNDQPAGQNDIACLPSEYDITQFVDPGRENRLTLTVEKSLVTRWSRRELGGITRDVYLQALPPMHLARVHVDTDLAPDHARASVHVRLRITNQGETSATPRVRVAIRQKGQGDLATAIINCDPLGPGESLDRVATIELKNPALWSAESPALYEANVELLDGENSTLATTQRFGVRDVRVDGNLLRINGVPVKLRGTNYHITYPGLGESVPKEKIASDIRLFQEANFNAMRSRPTPSVDYVDLCDEMGMYTTVEAMISLMMYDAGPLKDHGANPAITEGYRHHVATMIESLYSHPSIITWGLGNECPYYDYFKDASYGMKRADPTRPLFFGSDARLGVSIPGMDINDDHYPRDGKSTPSNPGAIAGKGWVYPDDRPAIFTEWMHVPTNNLKEIDFDPGLEDFWGFVARAHIEYMNHTPNYAGGFLFLGAPYRGVGVTQQWRGIFDDTRRTTDLFWHVKKAHSPVQVHDAKGTYDPEKRVARFAVENRYDFTALDALKFEWSIGTAHGVAKANGMPHSDGTIEIPLDVSPGQPIDLRISDASGRLIDQYRLSLASAVAVPEPVPNSPKEWAVEENERDVRVRLDSALVVIDRTTGLIGSASVAGERLIDGAPTLLVLPAQLSKFRPQEKLTLVNQCSGWKATDVKVEKNANGVQVIANGTYENAAGTFTTSILRSGEIRIAYDFKWTQQRPRPFNCFSWGLAVPVTDRFNQLQWNRTAQWSAYPEYHIGRSQGTAIASGPSIPDTKHIWSHVLVDGVTRDFRSTKLFIRKGGLFDSAGAGLEVRSDGQHQHLQAVPMNGDLSGELAVKDVHGPRRPGYFLQVLRFHNGGTEPHLTKSLTFETLDVNRDTPFLDTVSFRIIP